jgi:hypothetical protein
VHGPTILHFCLAKARVEYSNPFSHSNFPVGYVKRLTSHFSSQAV